MIWTDDYLNKLAQEGAEAVNIETPCVFHREYIAIPGIQLYLELPGYLKSLTRVTFKGRKITPISRLVMMGMFPNRFNDTDHYVGDPYYYYLEPGIYNSSGSQRLYLAPIPDVTFSASGGDPYSPVSGELRCTLSMMRYIDDTDATLTLPDYISIPIRRAYALWQAFKKEGPGQDLKASSFWEQKYQYYLDYFRGTNERIHIAKVRTLTGKRRENRRPAKPVLPSNFERVVY